MDISFCLQKGYSTITLNHFQIKLDESVKVSEAAKKGDLKFLPCTLNFNYCFHHC